MAQHPLSNVTPAKAGPPHNKAGRPPSRVEDGVQSWIPASAGMTATAEPPPAYARHPKSIRILNSRVDQVTQADAIEWVKSFLADGAVHQVITANTLMLIEAQQNAELVQVIESAALVVPESSGVAWAAWQMGTPLDSIVPGIDLFQALCRLARDLDRSIYLLGAQPGVAEQAAVSLSAYYPGLRVAGTHHGYFSPAEEVAVVANIHEASPGFLFVALSVPAQELWIKRHLAALGVPVVMGVGGSLDVISGRLRRAPGWLRELNLEWLYRTVQEPWRLKRIIQLPLFVWKILRSS